jgi:hypothetical protein
MKRAMSRATANEPPMSKFDGKVDARGGDDERHAHGDENHRRCAINDVDEAAVEPAVAHLDVEESLREEQIEQQQQRKSN